MHILGSSSSQENENVWDVEGSSVSSILSPNVIYLTRCEHYGNGFAVFCVE